MQLLEVEKGSAASGVELPATVSREDLYALVWSEPMSRLARRFGLSDVGLAKACTRMMIPVPGRGYWAKKEVGRAPRATRLPTLPASAGDDKRELRVRRREAPTARETAGEDAAAIVVAVPEILTAPHPLVAKSVKAFRGGRSRHDGILTPRTHECLAVEATMGTIDRAMRIYDATIKAIEDRGHVVEIQKYSRDGYEQAQYRTVVLIDGEQIEVEMFETTRRVERTEIGGTDLSPRYEFIPSGQLAFAIRSGYGRQSRWSDGGKQTVESQLGKFIRAIGLAAVYVKEVRRQREQREQEELEARRREWEEADRRRAEAGRIRALNAAIDRMHSARWAREYLEALQASLSAHPEADTPEMQAWVTWVERYANTVDQFIPHAVVPKDPNPYG